MIRSILKSHLVLFSAVLVGCAGTAPKKNLAESYNTVASEELLERNPVIVIPGIMGSKLIDSATRESVWGVYKRSSVSPKTPEGARYFALPMAAGRDLHEVKDGVISNGVLDTYEVNIFPGLALYSKPYIELLGVLGAGGYVDEELVLAQQKRDKEKEKKKKKPSSQVDYGDSHFSCFQFDYDWRRSNVENAARLKQFIRDKKKQVEASRLKKFGKKGDVKFDIVAHSMGGLLCRYYMQYGDQPLPAKGLPKLTWEGVKDLDKVVLVGSPHLGSLNALTTLNRGLTTVPVVLPHYHSALVGTMPAVYELLPRARHGLVQDKEGNALDVFDINVWKKYEWGLASSKNDKHLKWLLPEVESAQERREIALEHLGKCLDNAKRFHQALDRKAKHPDSISVVGWAGDSGETLISYEAREGGGKGLAYSSGDETVPRYSAAADNRGPHAKQGRIDPMVYWDDINYIYKDHIHMTQDLNFSDNLLAYLLNQGGSIGVSRKAKKKN